MADQRHDTAHTGQYNRPNQHPEGRAELCFVTRENCVGAEEAEGQSEEQGVVHSPLQLPSPGAVLMRGSRYRKNGSDVDEHTPSGAQSCLGRALAMRVCLSAVGWRPSSPHDMLIRVEKCEEIDQAQMWSGRRGR